MGLFDSTIQNLSNMALNESGCEIPQVAAPALVDEFKAMLDIMPTLNESEMKFPVHAVPVRECSRLGKYLIEMEDISRYMMTNAQTNILEAIVQIGKFNGITLNETNTALVIDEASILQEMDNLGMDIGGGNSNEGNIGTVGLLGPHTDIGKFRRFANSREFIDLVANKYGLPIVKKNYSIGLIKADEGSIKHNGNLQESAPLKTTGINAILQEKDKEKKQEPVQEDTEPISEEYTQLDMIRDIALGKYDNELMAESVGGPAFDIEKKKDSINESWLGRIFGSRGTTERVQARKAEEMRPINQADRDAAWAQYQKEEQDKKVNNYAKSNNLDMSKPGDRFAARWGSFRDEQEKQQAAKRAAQAEANRAAIRAQAQNSSAAFNSASSGAQPAAAPKPAPAPSSPAQTPAPTPSKPSTPTPTAASTSVPPAIKSTPNPPPSGGPADRMMQQRAATLDNYRRMLGGGNPVTSTGGNGTQTVSGVIRMGQVVK